MLTIFAKKTAPAFEVALRIGALQAGAEGPIWDILQDYSESLGIAYQIRDDLSDLDAADGTDDVSPYLGEMSQTGRDIDTR